MNLTLKIATALVAALAMIVLTACGGDEGSDSTTASDPQQTDGAFIAGMIPHHEAAIGMAELAANEAEHPEISQLAEEIIAAQGEEISQLEAAHERIFGGPVEEHGDLGLSEEDAGMSHDASGLEGADPFDEAFIDMMIPHHQGAIRMARVELANGEDPELQELAQTIIDAQSAEIEQMNDWRTEWYGEPSPAGGVPSEDETADVTHGEMGH